MRTPLLAPALALCLIALAGPFASGARAHDVGFRGKKLVIIDTAVLTGKTRLTFQAKDSRLEKGAAGNPALLSGSLQVFFTDNPTNASILPMPSPWWISNVPAVAKFSNKVAPAAPSAIKAAMIKPGKLTKVTAKAMGDIDISAPPGPGGVTLVLTVTNGNDGSQHRMCTRFSVAEGSTVQHRSLSGGVARKLIMKNGVEAACPTDCSDGFQNGDETGVDCGGSCGPCDDGEGCADADDCTSGVCTGNVCQAPTCTDGVKNQDETDLDCGGSCGPCANGDTCADAGDCTSGVCTGNVCQVPTCTDGVENQDETDLDCGGSCGPCVNGDGCEDAGDCQSGVCTGNLCQAPQCGDGVKNQDETDVDCGGSTCPACGPGDSCSIGADCTSSICQSGSCTTPTCGDGVENQDETDTDCGGSSCGPCANGDGCAVGTDCQSQVCSGGICQVPTCSDSHRNQNETDVDCGGVCPDCAPGQMCGAGTDCTSSICSGGFCTTPNCSDGAKNQNESAVDCGGVCADCGPGSTCNTGADCTSSICSSGVCSSPTCSDGVKNQNETDIDCGGSCGDCALGRTCGGGSDCLSGTCSSGVCRCGSGVHTFSINSSTGGVVTGATWPGGNQSFNFSSECTVTIKNPTGRIDLVGNLGDKFSVNGFTGFSNCFGSGGEDGDGCNPNTCPFAGIGFCEATRPSCSVALNGSGSATYRVQCNQ